MRTLIGLNGLKGSGKDTAGAYFVERHGFTRLSFASPLKRSAAASIGLPADEMIFEAWKNNPLAKLTLTIDGIVEKEITVREYLQLYGTEGHRMIPEFGLSVWTNLLINSLPAEGKFVVTDARFVNECSAVRDAGGIIMLVDREDVAGTGDTHASEDPLPDELVDVVLLNNGTISDLHTAIDAYLLLAGATDAIEAVGTA